MDAAKDRTAHDRPSPADVSYREILTLVVQRFVRLVGAPAAVNIARRLPGLAVDAQGNVLDCDADSPLDSVVALAQLYQAVFGNVAITLAQEAAPSVAQFLEARLLDDAGHLFLTEAAPMRILLVDDHILFREGLAGLLHPQPDMKVVGQAGSVRDCIALAQELRPDLVLMDFSLPDGTGVEATYAIQASAPNTKVVFLTVHEDDARLFAAVRAGAVGYLFKNVRAVELLNRLRDVALGAAGISPAVARRVLDEFSRTKPSYQAEPNEAIELTAREHEIVVELARGATNREIAQRFSISENTVKNHVRNVLGKLHLRSRRDVADYAREHGLLSPSFNWST